MMNVMQQRLPLVEERILRRKSRRKSPAGIATNELVFSAYQGTNEDVFPQVLSLYVSPGSTVADVTYGMGVFWKRVPPTKYRLLATDLKNGIDSRNLPYEDCSVDCVVFDPPYMHTPGGTAHVNHQNYEGYYRNNAAANGSERSITKRFSTCISRPRRRPIGFSRARAYTSSSAGTKSARISND
jgi:hypothetical protein